MFCKSCGKQIDNDSVFCSFCGTRQSELNKSLVEEHHEKNAKQNVVSEKPLVIQKFAATPLEQTDLLADIKVEKRKAIITFRIVSGSFFTFCGFFLFISYYSFLLLRTHSIRIPNIYMYNFWGKIFITPALGIHFFSFCGTILLFGSFLSKKYKPIGFKKSFAAVIDGVFLLTCIFLFQMVFNGDKSFRLEDSITTTSPDSFGSWLDTYDVYIIRVIVCSLFFAIYYFVGQMNNGTFGARAFKLSYVSLDEKKINLKQALLKTLYYGISTWAVLMFLLSLGKNYPFYTNTAPYLTFEENNTFVLCLWINFFFMLTSVITMLFDKQNRTLAEVISKSKTIIRQDNITNTREQKFNSSVETNTAAQQFSETTISNDQEVLLDELYKLVEKEKRKLISGQNLKIIDTLKLLITDKDDFLPLNNAYYTNYQKGIIEHLTSINSSYAAIYYYVEPLVELGVCEKEFPHNVL